MKLAELFVDIIGRTDGLNRSIAGSHQSLLGLKSTAASVARNVTSSVAGMGRGMTRSVLGGPLTDIAAISSRAMGLAALAAPASAGFAVKQAADLEKAFSQVRKTTGLTGNEFSTLRSNILAMANTMAGVSVDELIAITAMAGRLGIQGAANLTAYTRAIAMVRIALDDIPADAAAESIQRILNVFHLGADSALSFASALNKMDDTTTASAGEILTLTQMISGTASAAGASVTEILALSAALKDAGVRTEIGATAFSQLFGQMALDTKSFARVAGVSAEEFTKAYDRSPVEAVKLLAQGIAKLGKREAFEALNKLGLDGARVSGSLLQLSTVINRLDGYIATANSEWSTHASIEREVTVQSQTAWAQIERLWNQVRIMATGIGSQAIPIVKALAAEFGALAIAVQASTATQQGAMAPWMAKTTAFVSMVGFVWRNAADIIEIARLQIAQRIMNIGAIFTWIGGVAIEAASYFARNWPTLIQDALIASVRFIQNYVGIWRDVFKEIMSFLSNPAQGFDFNKLNPIENWKKALNMKGAKFMTEEQFKLPPLELVPDPGLQRLIDEAGQRIGAREIAAADAKAKAATDAAVGGGADAPAKGNKPSGGGESGGKTGSEWIALQDFYKKIADGIRGDDNARKTADNTAEAVMELRDVNKNIQASMSKPGSATWA